MKIRIINSQNWERSYDFDKSIIRVGSQVTCDILLKDTDIQPLHLQFVRRNAANAQYKLRAFSDNVTFTRGNQDFPMQSSAPYDVLDGDTISFASYRLVINLGDEKARTRTSEHMMAELSLQKRELSLDAPINGMLHLRNLGTEKPCQFKMRITGIPEECLQSAPLPFLYPGGSSSVGFLISHLQTRPAPGFHTVSITLMAPDEYFGEVLEFNQDIYVAPVFKNEIVLEDDSGSLKGFNSKLKEDEQKGEPEKTAAAVVSDSARMNYDEGVTRSERKPSNAPVIVLQDIPDESGAFSQDEDSDSDDAASRRRKNRVVVIRHDVAKDEDSFGENTDTDQAAPDDPQTSDAVVSQAADAPAEAVPEKVEPEQKQQPETPAEKTVKKSASETSHKKTVKKAADAAASQEKATEPVKEAADVEKQAAEVAPKAVRAGKKNTDKQESADEIPEIIVEAVNPESAEPAEKQEEAKPEPVPESPAAVETAVPEQKLESENIPEQADDAKTDADDRPDTDESMRAEPESVPVPDRETEPAQEPVKAEAESASEPQTETDSAEQPVPTEAVPEKMISLTRNGKESEIPVVQNSIGFDEEPVEPMPFVRKPESGSVRVMKGGDFED